MLMELLYASWRTKSQTFPLPSARLKQLGVSRDVKRRVLRDLECGRVIEVRRASRKIPTITLVGVPKLSRPLDSSVDYTRQPCRGCSTALSSWEYRNFLLIRRSANEIKEGLSSWEYRFAISFIIFSLFSY